MLEEKCVWCNDIVIIEGGKAHPNLFACCDRCIPFFARTAQYLAGSKPQNGKEDGAVKKHTIR